VNTGIRIIIDGARVTLEVDKESATARRDLGVVAWTVLETLALAGQDAAGGWVATTNARDLGRRLGIGKDRAASALATLRRAGLVAQHTTRDATTARFAASSYEITLPIARNVDQPRHPSARSTAADTRSKRSQPRHDDATLDLFSSPS
jgi:hypothetical protein